MLHADSHGNRAGESAELAPLYKQIQAEPLERKSTVHVYICTNKKKVDRLRSRFIGWLITSIACSLFMMIIDETSDEAMIVFFQLNGLMNATTAHISESI